MKHNQKRMFLIVIFLYAMQLQGHGFGAEVFVSLNGPHDQKFLPIKYLCKEVLKRKTTLVTVNPITSASTKCLIKSVGKSIARQIIYINVNNEEKEDVVCTPQQEFYLADRAQWVPAYKLKKGDVLWAGVNKRKTITKITLINRSIKVYALHVDKPHTFFVGRHELLAHNLILPLITIGLGASFGAGATVGGLAGGWVGPVGATCGIVVGGVLGATIRWCVGTSVIPSYYIDWNPREAIFQQLEQEEQGISQKPQASPKQKEKPKTPPKNKETPKKEACPPQEKEKTREEKIKDHKRLTNKEARAKAK